MKFNKPMFMLMIILVIALVVGCSSGTETPQKVTQENAAAVSEGQKVALPEEQPALFGKVQEIVGNEVTVFKGEVRQNEEAPQEEPVSAEAQEKIQAIREKIQNGTITPEQAREELQSLGFQPNQNPNRAMQFTEETETFIIPVGTPIVTIQRGANTENEANQVGLTDIKKDSILRIWKNDDDTVSFVQVFGGGSAMGNRQGAGGQGPGAGGGPGMMIFGPAPGGGRP